MPHYEPRWGRFSGRRWLGVGAQVANDAGESHADVAAPEGPTPRQLQSGLVQIQPTNEGSK